MRSVPRFFRSGIIPAYAGNTPDTLNSSSGYWDHPRVCGEHWNWGDVALRTAGSSPRMRGTPYLLFQVIQGFGIIPAYAGNTRPCRKHPKRRRDHPRVCGEHHLADLGLDAALGSSPRMRGTLSALTAAVRQVGIIPAYAGNTHRSHCIFQDCRDHPRVCGEHLANGLIGVMVRGSSPRMRGTLIGRYMTPFATGIIPAYAGNTNRFRTAIL